MVGTKRHHFCFKHRCISFIHGFFFAPNISLIDNFARSAILFSVSILTSLIFVSKKMFNARVVDSVGDALLVIDPKNYQIISANETAYKQLNFGKDDLIGKKSSRKNTVLLGISKLTINRLKVRSSGEVAVKMVLFGMVIIYRQ
jgi:hypothetical protein